MTHSRKSLGLAVMGFLVFGMLGVLWAFMADHNRPNPLMDYVPQELGMLDTHYEDLDEHDCRSCHGISVADRHHWTDIVRINRQCEDCHDIIPNPPGVMVYRDCVDDQGIYGCHNWASVLVNGWHHDTDFSHSENCTTCHNPNLIAPIDPARALEQYQQYPYPTYWTPSPWGCENCHWEQAIVDPDGDPYTDTPAPGHPSSYDHYNVSGQGPEYLEYGREIRLGSYTHHFGTIGNLWPQCDICHGLDPGDENYNPYDPELIRYCMLCHDIGTLHTIPPHVVGVNGWEAVGFHDPEDPGTDTPDTYRIFTANEKCVACHFDAVMDTPTIGLCTGGVPAINHVEGISPNSGMCAASVMTLRGTNFGEKQSSNSFVQMRKPDGDPWTDLPANASWSWSENQIEFEIPDCVFSSYGNCRVRVRTDCGVSNEVGFTVTGSWGPCWLSLYPRSGPCRTWIRFSGLCLGETQHSKPSEGDGYNGIARFVVLSALSGAEGPFVAKKYKEWSESSIDVRVTDFFQDLSPQNYVQDPGEADVTGCEGLVPGYYRTLFVTVHYGDDDGTDTLTDGDTILNECPREVEFFELTDAPYIRKLNAREVVRGSRLRIRGFNFGDAPDGAQVRIGSKAEAASTELGQGKFLDRVKFWSDSRIAVKLKVAEKYEGKRRFVWVEKDTKKSNYKRVNVLPVEP